jgi:Ni/Fe-hydrogenase subunit HybB-like protein
MKTSARPVGGKLVTPVFRVLVFLWALATAVLIVRWARGLGAVTALNDGYPWGLWIAVDVAAGTGLASGGYALALLVFVFNRGRYHPLVRPALVTSFLGYTAAATATVFDVGRYWNLWRVPLAPWDWNLGSILLQVALCELLYVAVLAVEIAPAFLERWRDGRDERLARFARRVLPGYERALPFVIALGLVLPVMHQTGLGALLLVAKTKVHPLWYTPFLPLLFLLTSLAMGYAIVCLEAAFSSIAFRRRIEGRLLGSLGTAVSAALLAFVAIRLAALMASEDLALTVKWGGLSFAFWGETLLCLVAAALFLRREVRENLGLTLQAAFLALAGTTLHRLDVFLVAFDPGAGWRYFPSVGEVVVTLGLVATETMIYLVLVRKLPVLGGVVLVAPAREAPAAAHGVAVAR